MGTSVETSPGSRLGPYEIVSRIGAGGMGEVFQARDTQLEHSVAIKILPAELAHNAQFRLRFEREAKTISQLSPNGQKVAFIIGDPLKELWVADRQKNTRIKLPLCS
jgi:serine/threonine protein kinase